MCAAPDCKRWLRTRDVSGYCGVCAALPCGACRAPGGYWLEHGECKPERPLCHHERALGHRLGIGHVLGCEPERDPAYIQRCEALRVEDVEQAHTAAHYDMWTRLHVEAESLELRAELHSLLAETTHSAGFGLLVGKTQDLSKRALTVLLPKWTVEAGVSLCRGCAAPEHSGSCKCGDASCERCK